VVTHWPPWQHPPQDWALQTHWPLEHKSPGPQALAPPQVHCPLGLQPSALPAQAAQTLPAVGAQVPIPKGVHTLPTQQPVVQLLPSQVQPLMVQLWPRTQAAPWLQAQVPVAEQLLARVGLHALHVPPAVEQSPVESGATQPPSCPQQPLLHEVAWQRQRPFQQLSPRAHSAPAPQAQPPLAPQPSERAVSHAWQRAPTAAQVETVMETQAAVAVQQPVEQDRASQMHVPLEQRWPVPQPGEQGAPESTGPASTARPASVPASPKGPPRVHRFWTQE